MNFSNSHHLSICVYIKMNKYDRSNGHIIFMLFISDRFQLDLAQSAGTGAAEYTDCISSKREKLRRVSCKWH